MLKGKYFNFTLFLILVTLVLNSCESLKYFFPHDYFYYPVIANGYDNSVTIKVLYFNNSPLTGEIPPNVKIWEKIKGLNIIQIKIYDKNNNLIADYPEQYLNLERQEKGNPGNELWVAYEGGLVLVPEEYHKGDDWQKYLEQIKKE